VLSRIQISIKKKKESTYEYNSLIANTPTIDYSEYYIIQYDTIIRVGNLIKENMVGMALASCICTLSCFCIYKI
jgi:hypothetical protein